MSSLPDLIWWLQPELASTMPKIAEKVKTSTSTVSKIGQIIKYGKGGLQKSFGK